MDLDELTQKYLKNSNECPFCGSSEISANHGDFEWDMATRDVQCQCCGKIWTEVYKMYDVTFDERDL